VIPPVARWMGKQGQITFKAPNLRKISFDLTTHLPNLKSEPVQIDLRLNGELLAAWSLFRQGWLTVEVFVPQSISVQDDLFELELTASRTWQPRGDVEQDRDDREISIAVCNIQVG
jgi:hypothetical protein